MFLIGFLEYRHDLLTIDLIVEVESADVFNVMQHLNEAEVALP
jgi:hypothetical protein